MVGALKGRKQKVQYAERKKLQIFLPNQGLQRRLDGALRKSKPKVFYNAQKHGKEKGRK